jgi:quercetin dioxygenase-like cupin family protein
MAASLEDVVRRELAAEGLDASAWGNGPGDRYGDHRHDYDKVLVATAGSIDFVLSELGRTVPLAAGDRLELPAGTLHAAIVGSAGVTCLEAHQPRGSLGGEAVHDAGWAGRFGRDETAAAQGA